MRVVHLIKAKQIGGAERHLLMLLPALIKLGVEVHLVVLIEPDNPMDELFAEAEQRGIPAQAIEINNHLDLVIINRIRATLNDLKPDILHTHLIHADTFGLGAGKLARIPHIITSRHNDDDFRNQRVVRLASGMMWNGFKACIAISDHIHDFVVNVEGGPAEKIHTIKYGIEHESPSQEAKNDARASLVTELGVPEDSYLIGMACRLVEQKGIDIAIKALAELRREYPNIQLVIAGDGDLKHALVHEVAELGLSDAVHFLGWRDDVPQIMLGLDIFWVPSRWEGFGLVALEAMSKRTPVIASRVSALPEVVADEESGLLVPVDDAPALAEATRILLNDRSLRVHMAMVGEDRVESLFSVERMAEETYTLYRRFVPEKPSTTTTVKRKVSIG